MATWYLLNTIRVKGPNGVSVLQAGELINDQFTQLSLIASAGGQVGPSSSAALAAASVIALKKRKQGAPVREIDAIMLAVNPGDNYLFSTALAGATVAAAAAIVTALTFTPVATGKVRVRCYAALAPLGAGTFTPIVKQGATTIIAPGQLTGAASQSPNNVAGETVVTGLTLYAPVVFSFVSTAGDATVTLGHGAAGAAAGLFLEELP
jgi:hypothetical protein